MINEYVCNKMGDLTTNGFDEHQLNAETLNSSHLGVLSSVSEDLLACNYNNKCDPDTSVGLENFLLTQPYTNLSHNQQGVHERGEEIVNNEDDESESESAQLSRETTGSVDFLFDDLNTNKMRFDTHFEDPTLETAVQSPTNDLNNTIEEEEEEDDEEDDEEEEDDGEDDYGGGNKSTTTHQETMKYNTVENQKSQSDSEHNNVNNNATNKNTDDNHTININDNSNNNSTTTGPPLFCSNSELNRLAYSLIELMSRHTKTHVPSCLENQTEPQNEFSTLDPSLERTLTEILMSLIQCDSDHTPRKTPTGLPAASFSWLSPTGSTVSGETPLMSYCVGSPVGGSPCEVQRASGNCADHYIDREMSSLLVSSCGGGSHNSGYNELIAFNGEFGPKFDFQGNVDFLHPLDPNNECSSMNNNSHIPRIAKNNNYNNLSSCVERGCKKVPKEGFKRCEHHLLKLRIKVKKYRHRRKQMATGPIDVVEQ